MRKHLVSLSEKRQLIQNLGCTVQNFFRTLNIKEKHQKTYRNCKTLYKITVKTILNINRYSYYNQIYKNKPDLFSRNYLSVQK